ncbi:chromosomal replication initiator protein DnaA [Clostridium sp. 'deep sea']|nr:chromosomal replication initiator protein DnaA [Clostridium sp. 'deep sea']
MESRTNKAGFDIWVKNTNAILIHNNIVAVEVPNSFFIHWLNKNYLHLFKECLSEICDESYDVEFIEKSEVDGYLSIVNNHITVENQQLKFDINSNNKPLQIHNELNLNPKYVFDTFVIGESNRFAHAASLAVAKNPAESYNPLFLYGGSGLGKTHLMHAIGHHVREKHPDLRIIYISSEKFINEFIDATQNNTTSKFRNKYRNADILMIDDIQFLENKERTQVEFFHTFNELYNAKKQLIISSDRPPREIRELEERLRSRFEWGLLTDIQPPELETRVAILRKKCEMEKYDIPENITFFIAENINSNIRELEGALTRINAYASINEVPLSIESIRAVLKDVLPQSSFRPVTIDLIKKIVAEYYNLTETVLISNKRNKSIVLPRQVAMFLARELTDHSLPKIGNEFGGRDHTTVLHSCDKINQKIKTDFKLAGVIAELKNKIKPK